MNTFMYSGAYYGQHVDIFSIIIGNLHACTSCEDLSLSNLAYIERSLEFERIRGVLRYDDDAFFKAILSKVGQSSSTASK